MEIGKMTDLDFCIITCMLLKPELMKEDYLYLDDYMTKHRKIWEFMKSFYNKFHNFDIQLMYALYDNSSEFETFIKAVSETYVILGNYNQYKETLITKHQESLKERIIIEQVGRVYGELQCRKINYKEFKNKIEQIYSLVEEKCEANANPSSD